MLNLVTSTIRAESLGPLVAVRVAVAQIEVNFCTHTYCVINLEIISLLKGPILCVRVMPDVYLFHKIAPVVFIKFEAILDLALGALRFVAPLVG